VATSTRSFNVGLYREHLEDASFLYEQRNALLHDGATPWARLCDFEDRLEAHIDALVIGGELALETCRSRLADGAAGELFAVVSVFCRNRDSAQMSAVWQSLDIKSHAKVRAVTDALRFNLPEQWYPACEQALTRGQDKLIPIISTVCASRRRPVGSLLMERLERQPELVQTQVVLALAKTSSAREAVPALEGYCSHTDHRIRTAALRGLVFAGERRALKAFYLAAQSEAWPQQALGLGGDQSASIVLLQCAEKGRASQDTLLALAQLGDVSALDVLCQYLSHPDLADTAALALHWITGAPLFEDAFVPEPFDELELLDDELSAWQQRRELPKRIDGKPFGGTIRRLTVDATQWRCWLDAHAGRFDSRMRHRSGLPSSPSVLLARLLDESSTLGLRQLAYDEMVVRFGCPVAFDPDWLVAEQRRALSAMVQWAVTNRSQFEVGGWQ